MTFIIADKSLAARVIKGEAELIDGNGPLCCYLSVKPDAGRKNVELVVGAQWSDRCAANLSKRGVLDLIDILHGVASEMRD